jgi:hypothetical protein
MSGNFTLSCTNSGSMGAPSLPATELESSRVALVLLTACVPLVALCRWRSPAGACHWRRTIVASSSPVRRPANNRSDNGIVVHRVATQQPSRTANAGSGCRGSQRVARHRGAGAERRADVRQGPCDPTYLQGTLVTWRAKVPLEGHSASGRANRCPPLPGAPSERSGSTGEAARRAPARRSSQYHSLPRPSVKVNVVPSGRNTGWRSALMAKPLRRAPLPARPPRISAPRA